MSAAAPRPPDAPVIRVALEVPLRRCFDYLAPAGVAAADLLPGQRVRVPFGRRRQVGVILACDVVTDVPREKLRRAGELLDGEPVLDAGLLGLLEWAAAYYRHPPGEVVMTALPALLRAGRDASVRPALRWRARAGVDAGILARAPRQRTLFERLRAAPAGLSESELDQLCEGWRSFMPKLAARDLVASEVDEPLVAGPSSESMQASMPATLTPAQAAVSASVAAALDRFGAFLLDGVTGAGKTEVYLDLAERVLRAGRQVLVLIPEISLAGQTLRRFAERFGRYGISVLHSGLADGERLRGWLDLRAGRSGLAIGTRSAVWVPLAKPGLIIVDEEHDLSFKQQEGFRYNARDVAVVRAQREGVPVLLGSATPSLESLHNVAAARYQGLQLRERAQVAMPRVRLLDVRDQPLQDGLSPIALAAIERHLAAGDQVLVFMNRRGWAPAAVCLACGEPYHCPRCDARLVYHRGDACLRCHHCGSERPYPGPCADCGEQDIYLVGQGTQRLEETLGERFPGYRLLRIDRDATRRKGELERYLAMARSGAARLLVGTQMLSKGHDFPGLALVVIVDTDGRLYGADFRAGERLVQLLIQVAGRAGRAEQPGEVLIQTAFPEHPALQAAAAGDFHAFAERALGERREAGLPPVTAMALLRAQAKQRDRVHDFLSAARALGEGIGGPELLGPAPAPMERLAGDYRGQLMIIAPGRPLLGRFLDVWLAAIEDLEQARRVRWSLDVDPQEVL